MTSFQSRVDAVALGVYCGPFEEDANAGQWASEETVGPIISAERQCPLHDLCLTALAGASYRQRSLGDRRVRDPGFGGVAQLVRAAES